MVGLQTGRLCADCPSRVGRRVGRLLTRLLTGHQPTVGRPTVRRLSVEGRPTGWSAVDSTVDRAPTDGRVADGWLTVDSTIESTCNRPSTVIRSSVGCSRDPKTVRGHQGHCQAEPSVAALGPPICQQELGKMVDLDVDLALVD